MTGIGSAGLTIANKSAKQTGGTGNWEGINVILDGTLTDNTSGKFKYDSSLVDVTGDGAKDKKAKTYGLSLISDVAGGTITHKFNKAAVGAGHTLTPAIELPKPTVDTTTGDATGDIEVPIKLDVKVGGKNKDYATSEVSAPVGTIVWNITPKY